MVVYGVYLSMRIDASPHDELSNALSLLQVIYLARGRPVNVKSRDPAVEGGPGEGSLRWPRDSSVGSYRLNEQVRDYLR